MLTKASKQKKNEKQFVCLTSSDDYYLLCNELLCGIVFRNKYTLFKYI